MARKVAHAEAIIDLSVNGTEEAKKKLKSVGNIKEEIQKDNIIQYKIELDKNGAVQVRKLQQELNKNGKNLMKVALDDSFLNQFKDSIGEIKNEAQQLRSIFQSIISNGGLGDGFGESSSEINDINKKLQEQKKIVQAQTDAISQYKKELNDLNNNSSIEDIDKKISELNAKKTEVSKKYFNETGKNEKYEQNTLLKTYKKYLEDKGNSKKKADFYVAASKFDEWADNNLLDDDEYERTYSKIINFGDKDNKVEKSIYDVMDEFNEIDYDKNKGFSKKDIEDSIKNWKTKKEESRYKTDKLWEELKQYNNDIENLENQKSKLLSNQEKNKNVNQQQINAIEEKIKQAEQIKSEAEAKIKELEGTLNELKSASKKTSENTQSSKNKGSSEQKKSDEDNKKLDDDFYQDENGYHPVKIKVANIKEFSNEIEGRTYNIKIHAENTDDVVKENIKTAVSPKITKASIKDVSNNVSQLLKDISDKRNQYFDKNKDINLLPENYIGKAFSNKSVDKLTGKVKSNRISTEAKKLQNAVKDDDKNSIAEIEDNLVTMMSTYNNFEEAFSRLTKKQKDIVGNSKIKDRIAKAKNDNRSMLNEIDSMINKIGESINSLEGKEFTKENANKLKENLLSGGVESASKYLQDTFKIDLSSLISEMQQASSIVKQEIKKIELDAINLKVEVDINDLKSKYKQLTQEYSGLAPGELGTKANDIYKRAKENGNFSTDDLIQLLALGKRSRDINTGQWTKIKTETGKDDRTIDLNTNIFQAAAEQFDFTAENMVDSLSKLAKEIDAEFVTNSRKAQKNKDVSEPDKELYSYITKKAGSYKNTDANALRNEIINLLKSSVDSGKPLTYDQNKDLFAMKESYKYKTKESGVLSKILKNELGITDFDKIFGGWQDSIESKYAKQYQLELDAFNKELEKDSTKNKKNIKKKTVKKKTSSTKTEDREPTKEELLEIEKENSGNENRPNNRFVGDVTLQLKKGQVSTLKSSIESGINPINIELNDDIDTSKIRDKVVESVNKKNKNKNDVNIDESYNNILNNLQEINRLKEEFKKSPGVDYTSLINPKDLVNGYSTSSSIKNLLANYDKKISENMRLNLGEDNGLQEIKDKIIAYSSKYQNLGSLKSVFGKEHASLWDQLKSSIASASKEEQKFLDISQQTGVILSEVEKIKGRKISRKESNEITNALKSMENPSSVLDKYINKNTIENENANGKKVTIDIDITQSSINTSRGKIEAGLKNIEVDITPTDNSITKIRNSITNSIQQGLKNVQNDSESEIPKDVSLLPENYIGNAYSEKNYKKGTTEVSQNKIKTTLKYYNSALSSGNESEVIKTKDDLVAMVATYENLDNAASAFGKNQAAVWEEVKSRVESARAFNTTNDDSKTEDGKDQGEVTIKTKLVPSVEELKEDINSINSIPVNIKLNPTPDANKIEEDINNINSKTIDIKLNVNPEVETIKKDINSIDGKTITIGAAIKDMSAKDISSFKEVFGNAVTDVENQTKRMINSIVNVKKSVKDLKDALKNVGLSNTKQVEQYSKEVQKIKNEAQKAVNEVKKAKDELKKEQEAWDAKKKKEQESQQKKSDKAEKKKYIDSINGDISAYEKAITKYRKYNESSHPLLSDDNIKDEKDSLYNNASKLEADTITKINEARKNNIISEEEELALVEKLTKAKEKELNLSTKDNRTAGQDKAITSAKKKYEDLFGNLKTDEDISNNYFDVSDKFDNVDDNLINRVKYLREECERLFKSLSEGTFENNDAFNKVKNELNNLFSEMTNINKNKSYNKNLNNVIGEIDLGEKSLKDFTSLEKRNAIYNAIVEKYGKRGTKVGAYVDGFGSNVEFVDESGNIMKCVVSMEEYTKSIKENTAAKEANANASDEIINSANKSNAAAIKIDKLSNTGKQYQSAGDKWISGFKNKLQNLTQYVTGIDIVMRAWNEIRQGFSFVNEFNASLTTINQTMSTTQEQLTALGKGALDAGKNLGSSAEDVLSAAAIYANASETAEGVLEKAKPTMLLANASGADVETVADQIQGVVNQFNELEGQETRIVNSYEKISSGLAIDFAKGINIMSEGVQTAGSVVEQAGMTFETYAASVGKISEKTRQEGSVIGNAYKTIMARMSRSKSADEDVSEEDRSNAAKAYKSIGIDLYDQNGQYKDINETLDELASKWNMLTDAQRNYISEQSAGVRNINTFSALIETWQEAQQLAKDATADADFYQSVQEKYMDSMEAKLNTLRASTEGFWNSLLDTGTINLGIDAINLLVQALQGLINIFKTIGDITGNGTLATLLGIGGIGAAGVSLFKNIKDARKSLGDNAGLFGGFGTGFKQTGSDIVNFFSTLNKGFASFGSGFIDAWKNNKGAGVSRLFTSLSEGAAASGAAIGKVSSALLGLTVGIAVVTALVKLFDALTDSSEETAQKVTEAMDAYNKGQEDLRNKKSSLDSISAEWHQLSKGVDSNGNNISLTNDEFARYHELCNKIADILPSTVSGFDSQGNAILNLTGKVSELNAEYDKLVLNQAKTDLNNLKDVQNDYNNKIDNKKPSTQIWDYFVGGIKAIKNGGPVLGYQVSYEEALKELEKVSKMNKDELQKYYIEVEKQGNNAAANWVYSEDGLDLKSIFIEGLNDENWATVKKGIQTKMQEVEGVVEESASNYRKMLQTQLKVLTLDKDEYPEYSNLDDSIINNISSLLDSLPQDKLEEFGRSTSAAKTYIEDVLKTFSNNKNYQISLSNILGINEDTSIEDIRNILDVDFENIKKALGITDDEGVAELKVKLKLDGADELIKSYDEIVTTAAIKLQEEGKKQLDSISKTYKNNLTDIDLYNRPVISSYEMNKHGWKTDDGTYSTYFSDIKNELDENGNIEKSIVFTPIYKDEKGNEKVLTPDEFEKETERILAGGEDTKGLKIAEFDSKDYKDSAKAAGKFAERLHKASDYYDLLEEDAGRVKDFIKDNNINTKEQIDLLNSLMDKYGNWSDVMANWGFESFDLEVNADSLDALESNLDIVKEKIGEIQEAYKESITSSGMTKESIENVVKAFSDLEGYNYDNLFESTASGVHMNTQELAKMNAQYEKHEKAKYEDKLKEEIKSYENICRAIEEANTLSEKQALIRDRDGLAEQIQRTNELISRYEGLTNAVTKYQQALEMGEEGDVYDSIVSGYENAKTLWEKGLVGTNEFKAFTQMFSNEDLTGKGVEAYVNAWQAAQGKMTRWLSEGGEGVENFLYDIRALNSEWAKLDANGNWNLDGLPDMKTLAKNLGISESLIDQMMRKLHDYGFEINFSEAKDNLRYMLQDAKEINKQFGQFSQFGLNDDDLKKVTSDAEQLQKMKEFKFNLEVSDPKALDEQISIAGKLRTALVDAFGNGSEEVEKFDKQLDYLKAKRGELTDVSTLAKEGYSLGLDFTKDKEALDDIIEKLMTIKGFNNMNINLEMNTIDDVNNNLDILTGKINNLARDGNGKVDLSADGAAEALELYSALIAKKREFDLTETSVYKFDSTKLKTGAQQNAIEYLQAFQKASSELQNAYDVNDVFGAGTIDVKPLETNMLNALDKIKNSGKDVQEIFRNLGFSIPDFSDIKVDDYKSVMNYVNSQIKDINSVDLSGIAGDLTNKVDVQRDYLKKLRKEIDEFDTSSFGENFKGLNLDTASSKTIDEEIERGKKLKETYADDSEAAKALQKQLDYLNIKKSYINAGINNGVNFDLNYSENNERIDSLVERLHSIDTYKNLEIDFKVKDPDDIDGQITNISKELEKLKDPKTGKIDFTQEGASELMDTMIALYNQKQLLTNEHRTYMNVDTSGATDAQKSVLGNVQRVQNAIDELDKLESAKKIVPDIDTSDAQKAVADAWKEIQNGTEEEKRIYANLGIEPDKIKVDSDEINDETQKAIQDELDPIDCEVLVNAGYDVRNIDKLTEDLDYLKDEYNVDIDIDWESLSPEYIEDKIEDLKDQLKDLRGEDGIVKIGEEGYDQARELMLSLIKMKQQAEGNVVLSIDTSQLEGETQKAITDLQEVMNAYQQLQALKDLQAAGVEVDTSELDAAQTKLNGLVADFANSHPETAATVGLTIKEGDEAKIVSDVNAALAGITADMMVKAGVDSTLVDGYSPEDKDATVTYNVNKAAVTTFLNSNIDRTATVTYNIKTVGSVPGGGHKLNGTAHLNGTAYANGTTGNWGAKKTETALVGEVAPELRVNSKTGRWELLGEHGAEFAKINKDDVIFNSKQTMELFKNGYVTSGFGRGRSFLNGTIGKLNSLFKTGGKAYAYGSYGGGGHFYKNSQFYANKTAAVSQGSTKSGKAADEFKETIDLIEIMIDRLERKINELDTIASSAYKKFSKRNTTLADEFSEVTKEIELQQKAYDAYVNKANSIGLDATWANRIRNGELRIQDITDEELKKKIDEFQEWYEKALDCKDAINDLNETLGDLVKQNFDNINDEFDYILDQIEHQNTMLENQLDIIENRGNFAGDAYFEALMKNEQDYVDELQKKYESLIAAREEAMNSGAIEEGSEAFYEMQASIDEVSEAYAEANNQLLEYKNNMYEMRWDVFDKTIEYLSDITEEAEFIRNLLSVNENDLFTKKTGRLNEKGMTSGALMAQDYNVQMGLADKYREKIEELNAELEKDPTNTILIDKKLEYVQAQREAIEAANDEKKAIQDLVSESYDRMLDVLQELIDKRKEALEAEKDLYDYQRDVEEQTKNITDLQKQLMALGGDTSEETRAKRQELQTSLKEAQSDLEETEYDQWLTDQEKMMDDLYSEYERILNERLDNIDGLLMDMIDYGNQNSETVVQTITDATTSVGYNITDGMNMIWNSTDSGLGKIMTDYSTNFNSQMTTINEYLKFIFKKMGGVVKEEVEQTKPKEPEKKPDTGGSSTTTTPTNPTPTQPPKKQITVGGLINAGSARIYGNSAGQGGGTQYFASDPIYTVLSEQNGYVLTRWHKLSSGYTGWFKKSDVTAMNTGGYTGNYEGMAMLHAKERVLNATQTAAFEKLVYDFLPKISDEIGKLNNLNNVTSAIYNRANNNNSTIENSIDLTLNLPNVKNGDDFIKTLQTDKNIQKIIRSFTIDEAMGKNSLRKFNVK